MNRQEKVGEPRQFDAVLPTDRMKQIALGADRETVEIKNIPRIRAIGFRVYCPHEAPETQTCYFPLCSFLQLKRAEMNWHKNGRALPMTNDWKSAILLSSKAGSKTVASPEAAVFSI